MSITNFPKTVLLPNENAATRAYAAAFAVFPLEVKFGECNPKKAAINIVRDEFNRYEFPIVCFQCDDPVCLKFCHQNAYEIKDGVIIRDEDRCIGCRLCAVICPYNAVTTIDDEIIKCDLCGGDPMCVKYCSTEARL